MIDIKDLITKILTYVLIGIIAACIYFILMLAGILVPEEGEPLCIIPNDFGQVARFTIKPSDHSYNGSSEIKTSSYKISGQASNWIDTGFTTNGEELKVFAYGQWFPWGEQNTKKITTIKYLQSTSTNNPNIQNTNVIQIGEDYAECPMNTDLTQEIIEKASNSNPIAEAKILDSNDVFLYSVNHLERYSEKYKVRYNQSIPADCIISGNCTNEEVNSEYNSINPCKLSRGAGVYMKIGNRTENGGEIKYAYHLKNHITLKVDKEKDSNGNFVYKFLKKSNFPVFDQIPFTLPIKIYDFQKEKTELHDAKDEFQPLINLTLAKYPTSYFLTRNVPENDSCNNPNIHDMILNRCYKSTTQIWNHQTDKIKCPYINNNVALTLHPDETCLPPKDQNIFLKFSAIDYSVATGSVTVLFTNGVNHNIRGLSTSFVLELLNMVLTPFWGSQIEPKKVSDILEERNGLVFENNSIFIKVKEPIFPSIKNDDIFLSTSKDNSMNGTFIVFFDENNPHINYSTQNYKMELSDGDKINGYKAFKITHPDQNIKLSLDNIFLREAKISNKEFFQIRNLETGLFYKARNYIISHHYFQLARVLIVLFAVMSYGIGFFLGFRAITISELQSQFLRFSILIWGTEIDNYLLFDKMILPFFYYIVTGLSLLFAQVSAIVPGTSIPVYNPYQFFDTILTMILSKEFFIKQIAITMAAGFWVFLICFPLFWYGVIKVVQIIIGNVGFLLLTTFNLGLVMLNLPIVMLLAMTEFRKSGFKELLVLLRNEAINLGMTLAFFGLFFGLVMKEVFSLFATEVCIYDMFSFDFFTYKFILKSWKPVNSDISGIYIVMKLSIFIAFAHFNQSLVSTLQNFVNTYFPSGGLGMNMVAANNIASQFMPDPKSLFSIGNNITSYAISKTTSKISKLTNNVINKVNNKFANTLNKQEAKATLYNKLTKGLDDKNFKGKSDTEINKTRQMLKNMTNTERKKYIENFEKKIDKMNDSELKFFNKNSDRIINEYLKNQNNTKSSTSVVINGKAQGDASTLSINGRNIKELIEIGNNQKSINGRVVGESSQSQENINLKLNEVNQKIQDLKLKLNNKNYSTEDKNLLEKLKEQKSSLEKLTNQLQENQNKKAYNIDGRFINENNINDKTDNKISYNFINDRIIKEISKDNDNQTISRSNATDPIQATIESIGGAGTSGIESAIDGVGGAGTSGIVSEKNENKEEIKKTEEAKEKIEEQKLQQEKIEKSKTRREEIEEYKKKNDW